MEELKLKDAEWIVNLKNRGNNWDGETPSGLVRKADAEAAIAAKEQETLDDVIKVLEGMGERSDPDISEVINAMKEMKNETP